MRRREFLSLLGSAAVSRVARADADKTTQIPLVGVVIAVREADAKRVYVPALEHE